jgi:hypothetical protein
VVGSVSEPTPSTAMSSCGNLSKVARILLAGPVEHRPLTLRERDGVVVVAGVE